MPARKNNSGKTEMSLKESIGAYLKELIQKNKNYKSIRQFCNVFANEKYPFAKDELTGENGNLQNTQNHFSQIFNGSNDVQSSDLLILCKLLDVSCEEILSAGKIRKANPQHITNYQVARSKNEEDWKNHIKRQDNLILNYDEYGKSVLDYAWEAHNYEFFQFLLRENYIWFTKEGGADGFTFGAGTRIRHREPKDTDIAFCEFPYKDYFRTNLLCLAIERNDMDMLNALHAREVPALFDAPFNFWLTGKSTYARTPEELFCNNTALSEPEKEKGAEQFYPCSPYAQQKNENFICAIAGAGEKILRYFAEEFTVKSRWERENTFLFPYLGDVIKIMLEQNRNKEKIEILLESAVRHNEKILKILNDTVEKECNGPSKKDREFTRRILLSNLTINQENGMLGFCYFSGGAKPHEKYKGFASNIIRVDNFEDNALVQRLNMSYQQIADMQQKKAKT